MSGHIVRVELIDVEDGDEAYEKLHAQMEKRGFLRTIEGNSGTRYRLPPAEYNYEKGDTPSEKVLDKAKAAAKETGHKARFLVTTGARRWAGLETQDEEDV